MALPEPNFTEADVHAIRATLRGEASADQQRRAMKFVLEGICHIFDSPYVANGLDRESFVMLGRHQVGVIITSTQTERVLEEARARDRGIANPRRETELSAPRRRTKRQS
jgi:hypothetical protein